MANYFGNLTPPVQPRMPLPQRESSAGPRYVGGGGGRRADYDPMLPLRMESARQTMQMQQYEQERANAQLAMATQARQEAAMMNALQVQSAERAIVSDSFDTFKSTTDTLLKVARESPLLFKHVAAQAQSLLAKKGLPPIDLAVIDAASMEMQQKAKMGAMNTLPDSIGAMLLNSAAATNNIQKQDGMYRTTLMSRASLPGGQSLPAGANVYGSESQGFVSDKPVETKQTPQFETVDLGGGIRVVVPQGTMPEGTKFIQDQEPQVKRYHQTIKGAMGEDLAMISVTQHPDGRLEIGPAMPLPKVQGGGGVLPPSGAPQPTGQAQPATAPSPSYPTAVNPQTGERIVLKDGQWQPMQ